MESLGSRLGTTDQLSSASEPKRANVPATKPRRKTCVLRIKNDSRFDEIRIGWIPSSTHYNEFLRLSNRMKKILHSYLKNVKNFSKVKIVEGFLDGRFKQSIIGTQLTREVVNPVPKDNGIVKETDYNTPYWRKFVDDRRNMDKPYPFSWNTGQDRSVEQWKGGENPHTRYRVERLKAVDPIPIYGEDNSSVVSHKLRTGYYLPNRKESINPHSAGPHDSVADYRAYCLWKGYIKPKPGEVIIPWDDYVKSLG